MIRVEPARPAMSREEFARRLAAMPPERREEWLRRKDEVLRMASRAAAPVVPFPPKLAEVSQHRLAEIAEQDRRRIGGVCKSVIGTR